MATLSTDADKYNRYIDAFLLYKRREPAYYTIYHKDFLLEVQNEGVGTVLIGGRLHWKSHAWEQLWNEIRLEFQNDDTELLWNNQYRQLIAMVEKYKLTGIWGPYDLLNIQYSIENGPDNLVKKSLIQSYNNAVKERKQIAEQIEEQKIGNWTDQIYRRQFRIRRFILPRSHMERLDIENTEIPYFGTLIRRRLGNVISNLRKPNPWYNNNCFLVAALDLGIIQEYQKKQLEPYVSSDGASHALEKKVFEPFLETHKPGWSFYGVKIDPPKNPEQILDAYLEPDTITMLVYSLKSGGAHVVTAYKNAHDNNIYIIDRYNYPRGIITDSGLLMSDFLRTKSDIKSIYLYFIVPRSIAVSQFIPPGSFSPKRKIKRKIKRKSPKHRVSSKVKK